jgi:hypothetical protein
MRFGTTQETAGKPTPPNYFARRQQYRLLALVFSLMVILLLMGEVAKPQNWRWMWGRGGAAIVQAEREPPAAAIDTRVPAAQLKSHPPGVFVSSPADMESPAAEFPPAPGALYPGVNPAELKMIRDDTVFRSAEANAWFTWCALMRDADKTAGYDVIARPVGFLQLFRQPDEYRGKLVRIAGTVRRAHRVAAHDNEQGIAAYWQCWLFTDEASTNPIVVYALDMPADFPTGMELHEQVAFGGLFFKRWAYQARSGTMTAPLILSPAGDWQPQVPIPPARMPSLLVVLSTLLAAAFAGGAISVFVYRQSNAPRLHRRSSKPEVDSFTRNDDGS